MKKHDGKHAMKPNPQWISDWEVGIEPERETAVGKELLRIFSAFWLSQDLESKSKTTRNRYANALHALGGFLVENSVSDQGREMSVTGLLFEHIDESGGPMIHPDKEAWQDELDMVCRKLFKFVSRSTEWRVPPEQVLKDPQ